MCMLINDDISEVAVFNMPKGCHPLVEVISFIVNDGRVGTGHSTSIPAISNIE